MVETSKSKIISIKQNDCEVSKMCQLLLAIAQ